MVKVPSFAKLNLDLRVLHKRQDEYHELRTIFQTISLKDGLTIEAKRSRKTELILDCAIEIEDNLVTRAARTVLEYLGVNASVRFVLDKKIPLGAGLGGGSSNAASVLIALPALLNKRVPLSELARLAERLGSDVAFFLRGGLAIGLGRGSEIYPLPDLPSAAVLLIASQIHVSTAAAYRALARPADPLTSPAQSPMLREFQTIAWTLGTARLEELPLKNDFEEAVFGMHPELAAIARKLRRLGANPVRMTGSGSAIFGVFPAVAAAKAAALHFKVGSAHPVQFVTRRQYQRAWRRALGVAAGQSCFVVS